MRKPGIYDYSIEGRDVDFSGRSTYVAVAEYILKAAGDDADLNGFGVGDLNCDNCSWVLSRMSIESGRRMAQHEKFSVTTWVSEISRMMTTRNMLIADSHGTVVASAVTQWAVIDLDKRTAIDIRQNFDYESAIIDEPSPIEKPRRIAHVNASTISERQVVYSDIDFNNHVTSVKYLEWMLDMLPIEWMIERSISRMDINFLHEARYGQLLKVCFENGERSLFEIINQEGLPVCKVALTWTA